MYKHKIILVHHITLNPFATDVKNHTFQSNERPIAYGLTLPPENIMY